MVPQTAGLEKKEKLGSNENSTCIYMFLIVVHKSFRVLTNSKFGLFYSNFLTLTPTFSKVPIEKYGKTPNFSG